MTAPDDRPGLAERYTIAADGTYGMDTDMLIAAGSCRETLGAMLLRLRGEFDSVKADIDGTGNTTLTDRILVLAHLKTLREAREALSYLAAQRAIVERFSQPDVMPRDLAGMKAWREDADRKSRAVHSLAGRVLVAFLDPNCHACDGRGKNGGYGALQTLCRACGGTSKTRAGIGRSAQERDFAGHLLSLVERSVSRAEQAIQAGLPGAKEVRRMVSEAEA